MNPLFFGYLFCILGTLSFHNFYISTTSIRFVPEDNTFQITAQVFLDDFEATLRQYGDEKIKLIPENSQEEIDSIVENYFRKNLLFEAKGEPLDFNFLGKVYRNDLLVAYMEMKVEDSLSRFSIKNTILFDLLPDQKNIIHLKLASKRKSFLSVSSKSEFEIPDDFFNSKN
jgi:hypothetical protein